MSDLFDRASALEQQFRDQALSRLRGNSLQPGYSHCEDCGDPIPPARQLAVSGCRRCVICQQLAED